MNEGIERPVAYLFDNGNAMFLDPDGRQSPEHQRYGWKGVHGFIEEHPSATVYVATWTGGGISDQTEIPERVVRMIKEPENDNDG